MVSEYNLAKDVSPIFQVYDSFGVHQPELDVFLAQPMKFNLKNQTIIFITPPQPRLSEIREHLKDYTIKLLAKRKGDGYTSLRMFNFRYIDHEFNQCPFCDYKVDSDELVQIEVGIERPKPRQKKRVMHTTPVSSNMKRLRAYSTDDQSIGSSSMSSGFKSSPSYSISSSYEMQANSPDSGIDTHFNGYNSDVACSPNSAHEYTTMRTQEQPDRPGTLIEEAQFVFAEDDVEISEAYVTDNVQFENANHLMEQDVGMFADEDEVRRMLGMPSENVDKLWGHQEIKETYEDVIENIDLDQLLDMEIPEEDGAPQTANISNIGSSFNTSIPQCMAANVMMTQRDPMISHGSMSIIKQDGPFTVKTQGPVVLQPRIKSDSTKTADIEKPKEEEVCLPMTEQNELRKRRQEKSKKEETKGRKPTTEQESPFVEDLPLFVMMFMVLLVIFKLIAQATLEVSHYAVVVFSMASAIFMIFMKNKMST
eukprot:GFUD01044321.1.p1 GENE.GFUD01044321.1~~GFUD01044321.1.p1  ORF type:complete len:526 (-),score=134.62 GFUD01044321.1:546-1985(-)